MVLKNNAVWSLAEKKNSPPPLVKSLVPGRQNLIRSPVTNDDDFAHDMQLCDQKDYSNRMSCLTFCTLHLLSKIKLLSEKLCYPQKYV